MSSVPFTRLNEEELFEIDPVQEANTDETRLRAAGGYSNDGEPDRRIDYVLVYETSQHDETMDEESAADAARRALLRASFERELEKQGLILHQRTKADEVRF